MYRGIPRLRASGSSLANFLTAAQLKRKASNSLSAVQDTFYSTKDIFERHRVVFTISTSIASVATAWAGYSIRHYHESRVDQRLEAIEKAVLNCSALDNKVLNCSALDNKVLNCSGKRHFIMKSSYQIQDPELKRLVSGTVSFPAFLATAGTSLIIGLARRGLVHQPEVEKGTVEIVGANKTKEMASQVLEKAIDEASTARTFQ
ncbi:uncharacterized protein LOC127254468 isoform X4 [Andrographis paniculata]|uniref:uncharacterized protein LOC127254468 isoform X4 n=1 Tax=Andrographis paniculata TaxID=175694 RepID=UPI0021E870FB|nr:uncharacterized protein LOC127254468 isoform X4 [Andrographis paniculata]